MLTGSAHLFTRHGYASYGHAGHLFALPSGDALTAASEFTAAVEGSLGHSRCRRLGPYGSFAWCIARVLAGDHRVQGEQTACGIAVSPPMHHHQVMNDGAIPRRTLMALLSPWVNSSSFAGIGEDAASRHLAWPAASVSGGWRFGGAGMLLS